jgi:hypothetical protein
MQCARSPSQLEHCLLNLTTLAKFTDHSKVSFVMIGERKFTVLENNRGPQKKKKGRADSGLHTTELVDS